VPKKNVHLSFAVPFFFNNITSTSDSTLQNIYPSASALSGTRVDRYGRYNIDQSRRSFNLISRGK
jgi:hypothetical protein